MLWLQVCFCPTVPIQPGRPKSDSASPGTIDEHNLSQNSPIKSLSVPVRAGMRFSPWVQNKSALGLYWPN